MKQKPHKSRRTGDVPSPAPLTPPAAENPPEGQPGAPEATVGPEARLADQIIRKNLANLVEKLKNGRTLTASDLALVQAFKGGKDMAPPARVPTISAMTSILGVTPKTFGRWRQRFPDFPKPNADWSWNTAAVLAFCQKHGLTAEDETDGSDGAEVELEIRAMKKESVKLDLAIKRREFAPVEELVEIMTALLGSMRSAVDTMPRSMALRVNPKAPGHAEAQLRDWRDSTFYPTLQGCIARLKKL